MPELPEVETTTNGLKKVLPRNTILGVWTDLAKKDQKIKHFQDTIKDQKFFNYFKKEVVGQKVVSIERRAKNILIHLSNDQTILIHLKMTGHLLWGDYNFDKKNNTWIPLKKGPLKDPYNRFIHFVFIFSNGKKLAFCDARKFGKITLVKKSDFSTSKHLKNIGPEPLLNKFTFDVFLERILKRKNNKIKQVLLDQSLIAGIGNIYSDEILWLSGVHPEEKVLDIPKIKLKKIFEATKSLLQKGILFGGDSTSDYRNIHGEKGRFQGEHQVYRKKGEKCGKKGCKGVILRKVVGGRSSHFCSEHQQLIKKNK